MTILTIIMAFALGFVAGVIYVGKHSAKLQKAVFMRLLNDNGYTIEDGKIRPMVNA